MTFLQIQYVLEIARCGSINKASQNLLIAQSHLSSTLKELEDRLGIALFVRTPKGVELTKEGSEFISYAQPLLDQRDKIMEMYATHGDLSGFYFRVSMQRFPFAVKAFIELFQDMDADRYEIHLREVGMYRVISDVYEKKSDIGIIYFSDISESAIRRVLAARNLEFHPISRRLRPRVFLGRSHPMAGETSIDLKDMRDYPYVSFEEETFAAVDFSEEVLLRGFMPTQKRIFIEDRATFVNLLTYTDAFTIGSGILPDNYSGYDVTSRPIAVSDERIILGYIKQPHTLLDDTLLAFIERVRANTGTEEASAGDG